jgi:hypothetical protein
VRNVVALICSREAQAEITAVRITCARFYGPINMQALSPNDDSNRGG